MHKKILNKTLDILPAIVKNTFLLTGFYKLYNRNSVFSFKIKIMKKKFFNFLAKFNKKVLPSFTKKGVQLENASKLQMAIFAYKLWVTKNALD
tara:strand:- start:22409 stop:22687 length:279 start_codon:yes stop_codon:yes gene_type:complete